MSRYSDIADGFNTYLKGMEKEKHGYLTGKRMLNAKVDYLKKDLEKRGK